MQQDINQKKKMEQELFRISNYHAISISKQIGNILLAASFISFHILVRDSIFILFIFLANNFLPFLFSISYSAKKEAEDYILPLFAQKYHYSYLKYRTNSLSFVCVCVMLFFWQKRILHHIATVHRYLLFVPTAILALMVCIRILGMIYYRYKFHKMLLFVQY